MAQQTAPTTKPVTNSSSFGVTSMVTGILSLVLFWIPFVNFSLSVVALIFGILGIKRPASKGMAIAGIATGSVGLLISIFQGIFWVAVFIGAAAGAGTYY